MSQIIFFVAIGWITLLLVVAVVLLVRARSMVTRILALDTLTVMLIALLALFSLVNGVPYFLDAALILALLVFVGTLAAARYYAEGNPFA